VVCDDDRGSLVGDAEPVLQPAAADPVQAERVVGAKSLRRRGPRDLLVVVDEVSADRHRAVTLLRSADLEVAPERAAEESHPADDRFVALEQVNAAVERGRRGPKPAGEVGECVPVRLMIARYVDDRRPRPPTGRRPQPRHAGPDVTGQDQDVGVGD
jgi:hypothetical protein